MILSAAQIEQRVSELGEAITKDYQDRDLVVVGVLKGAFVFMSDLVRQISLPLSCDFIRVSSYHGIQSSGKVDLKLDINLDVQDRDVLLVEDILETGETLHFLLNHFKSKNVASLEVCSLMSKSKDESLKRLVKYIGFEIPDNFVVGYGLDSDNAFRNLPFVADVEDSSVKDFYERN